MTLPRFTIKESGVAMPAPAVVLVYGLDREMHFARCTPVGNAGDFTIGDTLCGMDKGEPVEILAPACLNCARILLEEGEA